MSSLKFCISFPLAVALVSNCATTAANDSKQDPNSTSSVGWSAVAAASPNKVVGEELAVGRAAEHGDESSNAGSAVTTIAGSGAVGASDGSALTSSFYLPSAVAVERDGSVLIADAAGAAIRRLHGGIISTFAGARPIATHDLFAEPGYADGPATNAKFGLPSALVVTPSQIVYVVDESNHCIRKIENGIVSTYAGSPSRTTAADGPPAVAAFAAPRGIAAASDGTLYVADFGTGIRKIAPDGSVSTLELSGAPTKDFTTVSLWEGKDPTLFIGARDGMAAYRLSSKELTLESGAEEGEQPTIHPYGIVALSSREVVFSDLNNSTVNYFRFPEKPGMSYAMTRSLAGSPNRSAPYEAGFKDGSGGGVRLSQPLGLALTQTGDILVADAGNRRVRRVAAPVLRRAYGDGRVPSWPSNSYRILFVGNSYSYWNSMWPDSIAGQLEARLNSYKDHRNYKIFVARFDGGSMTAIHDYLTEIATAARPQLVIWSINSFDFGDEGNQFPDHMRDGAAKTFIPALLRRTKQELLETNCRLILAYHRAGVNFSPTEVLGLKLHDQPVWTWDRGESAEIEDESIVKAAGLPLISATADFDAFERRGDRGSLFETFNQHFSPQGNREYAEVLFVGLKSIIP